MPSLRWFIGFTMLFCLLTFYSAVAEESATITNSQIGTESSPLDRLLTAMSDRTSTQTDSGTKFETADIGMVVGAIGDMLWFNYGYLNNHFVGQIVRIFFICISIGMIIGLLILLRSLVSLIPGL